MNKQLRTAALLFFVPAATTWAQTSGVQISGVSHPETVPDQPLTTQEINPETNQAETVYHSPTSSAPTLQPRLQPLPYSRTAVTVMATPVGSAGRFDPDANIVTGVEGPANELPAGTFLKARIGQSVSTETTVTGTSFTAELTEPAEREGHILLPAGSLITGRVTQVYSGKRISGGAGIHLQPQTITLPDGTRYKLDAQVIDTDLTHATKVDDEGTIHSHGTSGVAKGGAALGTGSAAVAGAMLAGPAGALVGAGIGAGVSTVVWLREDQHATLPAETTLVFSLLEPLTFSSLDSSIPNGNPFPQPSTSAK